MEFVKLNNILPEEIIDQVEFDNSEIWIPFKNYIIYNNYKQILIRKQKRIGVNFISQKFDRG